MIGVSTSMLLLLSLFKFSSCLEDLLTGCVAMVFSSFIRFTVLSIGISTTTSEISSGSEDGAISSSVLARSSLIVFSVSGEVLSSSVFF